MLARRRVLLVVLLDVVRLHFGVHLVPAEVGDLCVSAVGQKRVDGVMEITLAATTTPSDVAMPASLISDLRAPRVRAPVTRSKINEFEFVPFILVVRN